MVLLILLAVGCVALHPDAEERQRIIDLVNNDPTSTWTAGINPKFENSTYDHVRQLCGVLPGGPAYPPEREFEQWELDLEVPDAFDAREQWPQCTSLLELRDQSACGSCWAMGGIAAATDRVCIQTNGTVKDRLSAEDLVGCCHSCGMGCNGGYPSAVWSWFKNTGVVTGGEYHDYKWCSAYSLKNVITIVQASMVHVHLLNIQLPNVQRHATLNQLTVLNLTKININLKLVILSEELKISKLI
eukprot:TRINITY_DN368_c0_g1_i2.p1 TRINITY_DN368_c0_g1~~TRINITY_DN368_c0_g1_i2.p1  ORF type:complete len:244 (+),score=48.45 TRINITY_DN368_c0_g1_i2:56-787(+)